MSGTEADSEERDPREAPPGEGEGTAPVFVLAWPRCAWTELAPTLALLAGFRELRVLATRPGTVAVREGFCVAVDQTFAAVQAAPGATILVPGGDLAEAWDDAALHEAVRRLAPRSRLVAGICNGAVLLARSGLLADRRCTHTCVERYAPRPAWGDLLDRVEPALSGSIWVDEDVVVDDRVVTAKPWAAISFGKTVATLAGIRPRADAAREARYLRGQRDLPGVDPHELWVITLRVAPGATTTPDHIRAHVGFLRRLEADGRLMLAGPMPEAACGMIVLRAASREEAERIMAEDPFVTTGVRTPELRRWTLSCADNDHLGRGPGPGSSLSRTD